ncbi:MAG: hypothetical protein R3E88_14970 [Myxococcota bacterium]
MAEISSGRIGSTKASAFGSTAWQMRRARARARRGAAVALRRLAFACALALLATGACVSSRAPVVSVRAAAPGLAPLAPPPDRAVVVFVQPTKRTYDWAAIYEDDRFVAVVQDRSHAVHETAPGAHRYAVVSEAADFLDAELAGGRVYFVRVEPRMGGVRMRYTLIPIAAGLERWDELPGWLAATHAATPNARALEWVDAHAEGAARLRERYLEKWLGRADRPALAPRDGVAAWPPGAD